MPRPFKFRRKREGTFFFIERGLGLSFVRNLSFFLLLCDQKVTKHERLRDHLINCSYSFFVLCVGLLLSRIVTFDLLAVCSDTYLQSVPPSLLLYLEDPVKKKKKS